MRQPTRFADLPADIVSTLNAFVALFEDWPLERHAISIGGSIGKGNFDGASDVDLRLWHDGDLPSDKKRPDLWRRLRSLLDESAARGVVVDGVWMRRIGEIDAALREWIAGTGRPQEMVWTVWGYHLPVDVFNQCVVRDPHGVLAEWRALLTPYPAALRRAVLARFLPQLRYWRGDYHYQSKVARGDAVFLASLTARLVHAMMQVLFALNDEYYVGDGANLTFAERFAVRPADFSERVKEILYPGRLDSPETCRRQADALAALVDEVIAKAADAEATGGREGA